MVVFLLLFSLAFQQPQVTVQADRDAVLVGGEVTVTIIVTASGADRVTIDDPELGGLELLDHRQQTRVRMLDGVPRRVTTRELTLRAMRPGQARIGTVRVRQGEIVSETSPILITVRAAEVAPSATLSSRVEPLLARTTPSTLPPDDVVLTVIRSSDAVIVGEQLDIVVVAWFPRDLRTQLRNPPTLEAPEVRGAWVYPRPAPAGVALSRNIGGRWYDLFVLHEVVFPLTAGTLEIGPASVSFSVPLSGSFLSRELRREAQSEPTSIAVGSLPSVGGDAGFGGAIGRDLEIGVDASAQELRQGDAARVRVEVVGLGNVSLWPEPGLDWPPGVKAYQQEVMVSLTSANGLVGGSKAYEYLVVADSVGTHRVPGIRYTYFDTQSRRYIAVRSPEIAFLTPGTVTTVAPVRSVQPLMPASRRYVPNWLLARAPVWMWVLVVVAPPVILLAVRLRRRKQGTRTRQDRVRRTRRDSPLGVVDAEFNGVLERLVPGAESKAGDDLADALRAAGVDASLAAHAARVRDRLQYALYGPEGATDPDELAAEAQEVLRVLAGGQSEAVPSQVVAVLVLFVTLWGVPVLAQTPAQLYQAGAVRVAADSFAARTAEQPYVAAHWFNLGNALDRLGEVSRARAAWLRAGRLAPRNDAVRRTLERAPLPDAPSDRVAWLSPVTPGEAFVGSVLCWLLGWGLIGLRRRVRYVTVMLVLALAFAAYGGYVSRRYVQPVALILEPGTPLRSAPYGNARAATDLEQASAVRVERAWGAWRLVSHGAFQGWVLSSEMVGL